MYPRYGIAVALDVTQHSRLGGHVTSRLGGQVTARAVPAEYHVVAQGIYIRVPAGGERHGVRP